MSVFVPVLSVADLLEGMGTCVQVHGEAIALFNIRGTIYATSDTCTHAEASLTEGIIEGDEVECPLHGARFNIKTGAMLCAPAYADLRTFPVRVQGEMIEVAVDD